MTIFNHESHSHSDGSGKNAELGSLPHASSGVNQEQRKHMIAEAAYYIAQHRHFQGGDPIHDWLQAQIVIDSKIKGTHR